MIGYGEPSSRSVTSWISGATDQAPVPPSSSCTVWAECGRNGVSSALQSLIACSAVCSTVSRRAGSSLSFHGAWSDTHLLASPSTRIPSVLVGLAHDPDRLAHRGLLPVAAEQVRDGRERRGGRPEQCPVVLGELP